MSVCAAVFTGGRLQGEVRYEVIPVGGTGYGLNNHGVVVGQHGSKDAFYWRRETGRVTVGSTTGDHSAMDVNDDGILVGRSRSTTSYGREVWWSGFAYDTRTGEKVNDRVRLTGKVEAINNLWNTTGSNYLFLAPNGTHYGGASWHVVPPNQPFVVNWGDRNGTSDINDRSIAVGSTARVRTPTAWIQLPTSGTTIPYGINDYWNGSDGRGVICGTAAGFPAYWDGTGALTVLNDPALRSGSFRRVNDHGQMVGQVQVDATSARLGVVCQDGQLVYLSDVVTTPSTIYDATDVNDRGQILAYSSTTGGAVLLNPVYMADGVFHSASLGADWSQSGAGTADILEVAAGEYCMRLTAGSPVTVSQSVSTPAAGFALSYDYQFLNNDPMTTLTVTLDGVTVDTVTAPDPVATGFQTRVVELSDAGVMGMDDVVLSFTYDGPGESQVLIDNVTMTQALGASSGAEIEVTSFSRATNGDVSLQFTSPGGNVDVYRSTDLQSWGTPIDSNVAPGTYLDDTAGTLPEVFYVLSPTGVPYP